MPAPTKERHKQTRQAERVERPQQVIRAGKKELTPFRPVTKLGIKGSIKPEEVPTEIHLATTGMWHTPYHGDFMLTASMFDQMIANHQAKIIPGLYVDTEHEWWEGSYGECTRLFTKPGTDREGNAATELWAEIEWTEEGRNLVASGKYNHISPEIDFIYLDPEDATVEHENLVEGIALTNRPLFSKLQRIVANRTGGLQKKDGIVTVSTKQRVKANHGDTPMPNLEEVLNKPQADLTDEDKQVLRDNESDLTDEQKTTYAEELKAPEGEGDGEGSEGSEGGDGEGSGDGEGAGDGEGSDGEGDGEGEGDGSGEGEGSGDGEGVAAGKKKAAKKGKDDSVTLSASQLRVLEASAKAGAAAARKLERMEVAEQVRGLTANKNGEFRVPNAQADKVTDFAMRLNASTRKQFIELLEGLPSHKTTLGVAGSTATGEDTSAQAELDSKIEKLQASKEGKDLGYSQAMKQITDADPDLGQRVIDEAANQS